MSLAIDVNVTAYAAIDFNPVTATTAPFSTTQTNELLIAFAASGNGNPSTGAPPVVSDTAGLTWTLIAQANQAGGQWVKVFYAWASSILTNDQVSSTSGESFQDAWVNVVSFIGANATSANGASAIGASNNAISAATTAYSVSITTTVNNSWVWGLIGSGDTVAGTPDSGQSVVNSHTGPQGIVFTQNQNSATPTSGTSVAISGAQVNHQYVEVALEILPGAPPTATPNQVQGGGAPQMSYSFKDSVVGY